MTYEACLAAIHSRKTFSSTATLCRIERLMERLGNPQDQIRCIHVAGTNGKGSVCAMVESALRESGFRTGLFTSPYLVDFRERIRICGENISKDSLISCYETVMLEEQKLEQAGYDVVACPSPMAPDRLEHLLIPQLSLAFLSSSPAHPYPGKAYRRLLLDNAVSADLLRRSRPRLRFSQKITSALMDEAVDSLSQAKAMHDDLEALDHPYVNFELVDETALAIAAELSLL